MLTTVLASASTLLLILGLPFYTFGYQLFGFRFTGENLLLLGVVSLINIVSSVVVGFSGNRRFLMAVPLGLASLTLATGFSIFADVDARAYALDSSIPWWGGVGCRMMRICLPKWFTGVVVGLFLNFYWFAAAYFFLFRTPVLAILISSPILVLSVVPQVVGDRLGRAIVGVLGEDFDRWLGERLENFLQAGPDDYSEEELEEWERYHNRIWWGNEDGPTGVVRDFFDDFFGL